MNSFFENVLVNDRYRVVRKIGMGGMGAVYEAVDERLEITVALKECNVAQGELRLQFGREARLLASLKHRALPRVFDYFTEGEKAFLTMEFVDGPTLAEVLQGQDGPFSPAKVIAWADQLLDVLIYLHGRDRQVIHRDIKPHNLKLTPSGELVLLDFGLAKSEGDTGWSVHGFTRRYSPLEQIRDGGTSERSDLYALGATLYQLLTGVKPDDAERRDELIRQGRVDPLRRADEVLPVIGEQLGTILERALALNECDRFENAISFRAALQELGRTNGRRQFVRMLGGNTWRSRVAAAAAVVSIFACAGLIFYTGRNGNGVGEIGSSTNNVAWVGDPENAEIRPQPIAERTRRSSVQVRARPSASKEDSKASNRIRSAPKQHSRSSLKQQSTIAEVKKVPAKKAAVAAVRRTERRRVNERNKSAPPVLLRAPNGTEVLRYPDGRLRVSTVGQKPAT